MGPNRRLFLLSNIPIPLDPASPLQNFSAEDYVAFVQPVADHTMQGFYGSPAHGGNRDETCWNMPGIQNVMEGHRH